MTLNVNSIVQHVIQIICNNGINVECKICCTCKKDYSSNPSTCIYNNNRYLKSFVVDSVIAFDEIINDADSVSTNVASTKQTNVSINCDNKKVRYKIDCYILQTFLLVTILLFMIAIIFDHYIIYRSKQKQIDTLPI